MRSIAAIFGKIETNPMFPVELPTVYAFLASTDVQVMLAQV